MIKKKQRDSAKSQNSYHRTLPKKTGMGYGAMT